MSKKTLPDIDVYIPMEDSEHGDNSHASKTDISENEAVDHEDDPNALLSLDLWADTTSTPRRRTQSSRKLKSRGTKEISNYIKNAGDLDAALLKVILETNATKFPEGRVTLFASELLQKGANVLAIDEDGNTPLHLSALRGFSDVAKELLRWGADPHIENRKHKTPLEIAVYQALEGMQETVVDYSSFATLMIEEMQGAKVRALFLSETGNLPKLSFHSLLDNEDMVETVKAVMDKLIERVPGRKRTYTVYYDLLESNKNGIVVRNPNRISLRRRLGKSAFDEIAWTGNKDAISHLVVRLMMHSKWKRFARNFLIIHFIYWVVTMFAISVALILAAGEVDPHNYNHPLDTFRAVCEGLAIFLVTLASLTELYHIYLWRLSYFRDYSFFIFSYLNLVTMLFIVIVIPLRVLNLNEQWIFASFLYMSYSVRVLRYVGSIKFLGKYIQILFLIFKRDLVPFVSILIILLFVFCGGFYFALREEVITPTLVTPMCNFSSVQSALSTFNLTVAQVEAAVNTSIIPFMTSLDINPAETSTYPRVFFSGVRLAVEGQSFLTYFGENGFGWLGVITYMIFLFFVEVILLNLLIAQMSDTFSNVQGDAQRSLAINRARTIISIERTGLSFLKCITDFYKSEEQWTNPQKHVEKLDQTSITNIHRIALRSQKLINQNASDLDDLRDSIGEQNLSTNNKLGLILRKLAELQKETSTFP